ncbi:hypothetical protein [Azospirillum sp. B510]|uniref:hypothetical protein n=1 Tax=Azospirillum sp. (strain B510) TaxID=137722 RepID=UPI0002FB1E46|nr:hypothetical protein [Azospirillum sp. B510]
MTYGCTAHANVGIGAVAASDEFVIKLSVLNVTSDTATIGYRSLPANRPKSYGDFLAIWQGRMIPWRAPPLARITIPQDTDSGSVVLSGFTLANLDYVVGYGTGPAISTIAASVPIPPVTGESAEGGTSTANPAPGQPGSSVTMTLASQTSEALAVRYATLPGYQPASYGNWIGIWPGQMSPYNAFKPLACADVPSDANLGTVAMNGLSLGAEETYTLVYFTGPAAPASDGKAAPGCAAAWSDGGQTPDTTQAAAMLVFQTASRAGAQQPVPSK